MQSYKKFIIYFLFITYQITSQLIFLVYLNDLRKN